MVERGTSEANSEPAVSLAKSDGALQRRIPPRLADTDSRLIDLTRHYNGALTQAWRGGAASDHLSMLPRGIQTFAGVDFDVRGVVQLNSLRLKERPIRLPERVEGIRVDRRCDRLHFLYAAGARAADGTFVGHFTVHHVDGQVQDNDSGQ